MTSLMGRLAKVGIVCGGYLLSAAAAWLSGHLYNARMAAMPYDTSGGMYAAGESVAVLGTFLAAALVPTLLGLWFLRRSARLWQAVAVASLAFACAGLIAVLAFMLAPGTPRHSALVLFNLLGLAQLLGVPLWAAAFALLALLAPTRPARRLLIAALGVEIVVGVCAAFHWFLPRSGT